MNRIVFQYRHLKIRVRDIVLIIVLILLLFFCMKGCQEEEIRKKKEDKVMQTCSLMMENVRDLNDLLKRSDLCSEKWYRDLDEYIERLNEQNILLKTQTKKEHQAVYQLQERIRNTLQNLKTKQDEGTIQALEMVVQEYQSYYQKTCKEDVMAQGNLSM